jgi:hypothetical protein
MLRGEGLVQRAASAVQLDEIGEQQIILRLHGNARGLPVSGNFVLGRTARAQPRLAVPQRGAVRGKVGDVPAQPVLMTKLLRLAQILGSKASVGLPPISRVKIAGDSIIPSGRNV